MTAGEARDVQFFLDSFQLGISEVHLLEKRLLDKLAALESQNIRALFLSETARARMMDRTDDVADRLDEAVRDQCSLNPIPIPLMIGAAWLVICYVSRRPSG